MPISLSNLEKIKKKMEKVPDRDKEKVVLSTKEAVQYLQNSILLWRSQGMGVAEIAKVLTEYGLSITASTLSQYLTRLAREDLPESAVSSSSTVAQKTISKPSKIPSKVRKSVRDVVASSGDFSPEPDTQDL